MPYEPPLDLGAIELKDAPRGAREHLRVAAMLKVDHATADLKIGPAWISWLPAGIIRRIVRWGAKSWIGRRLGL